MPRDFHPTPERAANLPDPVDAEAITLMLGASDEFSYEYGSRFILPRRKVLPSRLAHRLIPMVAATGRLRSREHGVDSLRPATWDAGEPWKLWLEIRQDDRDQWNITGVLRRAEERMPLEEPLLLLAGGFLLARGKVARFDDAGAFPWAVQLRRVERIPFPDRERDQVLEQLLDSAALPPMDLDPPLRFEERKVAPRLGLRLTQQRPQWGEAAGYQGQLLVDYGRGWTTGGAAGRGTWIAEERVYLARDAAAEHAAQDTLRELGLRRHDSEPEYWTVGPRALPRAVRDLVEAGWHVEAEGKVFRRPGDYAHGSGSRHRLVRTARRGGLRRATGAAAASCWPPLRRGENMVRLDDGTFGVLPEEWLARFGPLAGLGTTRRRPPPLPAQPGGPAGCAAGRPAGGRVRRDLRSASASELRALPGRRSRRRSPRASSGQLRDYQREGLGWMEFLRRFGFGGCLADDMGVGKTAQVLAAAGNAARARAGSRRRRWWWCRNR